jgi:PHD/YefM family antitoxin component YafN of YafNO toxin-antitoxin module
LGGQPIAVLDTQGRPVAILLDLNTYAEMEEAALTAGASG